MKATLESVPLAADKIVFDRFHIMKHMNDAVDKVRRQEHRALTLDTQRDFVALGRKASVACQGLTAEGCDLLKGTRHWWLYGYENVPDPHLRAFEAVRDQSLQTHRAWAIKETLRELWEYRSVGWAHKFFKDWFGWAKRSKLPPVKKVADMLRKRLANILTYCKHQITNGVAEGLNSKIMTIKRKACGYRSKNNFKTAIYFYCGGLDLYPR